MKDDSNNTNKRAASSFINFDDVLESAFPFLHRALYGWIEGEHINRLSIQFPSDGIIKVAVSGEQTLADGTLTGVVAYASGESLHGIFDFVDDALAYGDLEWRPDKYYVKQSDSRPKRDKKAVRRKL